ncbi:MAG: DEAD/DEAH box helicase family protein [Candidatus Aenigmarchaeota archaeon]|nr:DEAD/DEAH box helicase family protein [Candidatus Aenigmarchaeota archaeon]
MSIKSKNTNFHAGPESKARHELINPLLEAAGWDVQHYSSASPKSSKGVAVEFFQMGKGVGEADYVLFVNGQAVGIIEAKKPGETLTGKETQSKRYSDGFPEDFEAIELPLPFIYESTGKETRFTNLWDPKPRSREVKAFHTPETFEDWIEHGKDSNLRLKLSLNPVIDNKDLWPVQRKAIENTKESLALGKPKALIQMATGSGKTFTAVNLAYYLIKHAGAKRILFLVDRGNLGKQTNQEFENFVVPKDGRKFTELYNVQHMKTNKIESVSRVCISTIQRMYSVLKGEKQLDPTREDDEGFMADPRMEVEPIDYNSKVPIEEFDFIIVDECHRSIYNLWKQVLDYFDAFTIGLTATPSKSTIAFFDSNLVMEYSHDEAVADQVNVDFTIYNIRTKITKTGSTISKGEIILKRDIRTRGKRWHVLEDEVAYTPEQLDRAVVAKDQIRKIIRTFKENVTTRIFPGRRFVPKTLIYAKDDSHAEDIVQMVREEFNEGNNFAAKITYKAEGNKDSLLSSFRNDFNPRIAVTVDMIATGTDIKPLEIVFFMRPVKSRLYFEQMKGRGVRVMKNDEFKSVTPDAMAKERFVIIDAVGVCENKDLNETRPLEQLGKKVSFEKLLKFMQYGKPKREYLSSMACRLSRLQKRITPEQNNEIKEIAGVELKDFAKDFVVAIDPDKIYEEAEKEFGEKPEKEDIEKIAQKRMKEAIKGFIGNPKLITRLPEIKRETEQIIDMASVDVVEEAAYSPIATEKAKKLVQSFKDFIKKNKSELRAIQIFYESRGKLKWKDLKELSNKVRSPPYVLTTPTLWQAYKQLEHTKVRGNSTGKISDFISLIRFELGKTPELEPYLDTVEKRFAEWLGKQKEQGVSFNQDQLNWLEKIKQHVATTAEIEADDFEFGELQKMGGLGKAAKVFGHDNFEKILVEINRDVGG